MSDETLDKPSGARGGGRAPKNCGTERRDGLQFFWKLPDDFDPRNDGKLADLLNHNIRLARDERLCRKSCGDDSGSFPYAIADGQSIDHFAEMNAAGASARKCDGASAEQRLDECLRQQLPAPPGRR